MTSTSNRDLRSGSDRESLPVLASAVPRTIAGVWKSTQILGAEFDTMGYFPGASAAYMDVFTSSVAFMKIDRCITQMKFKRSIQLPAQSVRLDGGENYVLGATLAKSTFRSTSKSLVHFAWERHAANGDFISGKAELLEGGDSLKLDIQCSRGAHYTVHMVRAKTFPADMKKHVSRRAKSSKKLSAGIPAELNVLKTIESSKQYHMGPASIVPNIVSRRPFGTRYTRAVLVLFGDR